ncbi:FecR family protein [Aquimarina intermedia]|uniref:FecR family protein n=1 Tax=Aquimarina intermedia TaxID=350814 RepID=A0A5S5BYY9_9FLAO|nr:FecR domain-containing protein [Aquimarina intermedia]TYP72159.1 FecR family protein [Aquimarina intermedia]
MSSILTLIQKYLNGTISSGERMQLNEWLDLNTHNRTLFKEAIKKRYSKTIPLCVDTSEAHAKFIKRISARSKSVIRLRTIQGFSKYAAILVLLLGSIYLYKNQESPLTENKKSVKFSTAAIAEDKILIKQADGSITTIDPSENGILTDKNGNPIGNKEENQLRITSDAGLESLKFMEVYIPKGKQFQMVLSDGTQVWLNAGSTLKFPQKFISSEKKRVVYLEGEAFFDVKTNKEKPFIVKAKGIDVNVLGTQFNVSSYTEDTLIKTTLVEGSVALASSDMPHKKVFLKPNDQAVYNKNNSVIHKKEVNTDIYTSWMKKRIMLQNESFEEAFRRIERAYDVKIINHNSVLAATKFTGEFDVESIYEILKTFSETLNFTYTIKEKKITIHP